MVYPAGNSTPHSEAVTPREAIAFFVVHAELLLYAGAAIVSLSLLLWGFYHLVLGIVEYFSK